jgi:hypothetical protein
MPAALKTTVWLVKITVPLSLVVTLLSYFGIVAHIANFLNPVFGLMGLRGEASLVFITSLFLNIYSAIAVITQLSLTVREITILAVMCLIAHALIVETAVQSKTGSKAWQIVTLRFSWAIISGFVLNWILPAHMQGQTAVSTPMVASSFLQTITAWAESSFFLTIKIVILVSLLMILQQLLKEFGAIAILSKIFSPALRVFGLPQSTSFLWIVANVLGLAFGSAVMLEEVRSGAITKKDADLLNYHIAISHSNLEDLLLFAAIGAPIVWVLFPRLIIATISVWGRKWWVGRAIVGKQ